MTRKSLDAAAGLAAGRKRKDRGAQRALQKHRPEAILFAVALLEAIERAGGQPISSDATICDHGAKFADGGKYRGSAVAALARCGAIAPAGVIISSRRSRHAGLMRLWVAGPPQRFRPVLEALRSERDRLAANDNGGPHSSDSPAA